MKRRQMIRRVIMTGLAYSFPLTFLFLSPAIPFEGVFHNGNAGIFTGSLFVFGSLFLISLIAGRLFCGWLCPGGAFQESFCSYMNNRPLKRTGFDKLKFFLWGPWLIGLIASFAMAGGVKSVNFFFHTHIDSPFRYWGIYTVVYLIVSALIIVISVVAGRRGFCRTSCWGAPFMIIGRKIGGAMRLPQLRIKAETEKCTQCGVCDKKCPMGLDVKSMAANGSLTSRECILCGICVDSCPKSVLRYSFCRK